MNDIFLDEIQNVGKKPEVHDDGIIKMNARDWLVIH